VIGCDGAHTAHPDFSALQASVNSRIRLNFRAPEFAANSENNSEFRPFCPFGQLWQRFIQQFQRVADKFPMNRNSELLFRKQRNRLRRTPKEQRISSVGVCLAECVTIEAPGARADTAVTVLLLT
jgi:hypothetical protein